jgi:FkbM family methyltransferase
VGSDRASADYRYGDNEPAVQDAIVSALGPGDVFYDVGANVGFFSLLASQRIGEQGRVYAFEPVPENAAAIEANRDRNGATNVVALQYAVGQASGMATLYLDEHPGGATLSAADHHGDGGDQLLVEVVSVDDMVASGACEPPTVVKIDVEGMERAVLRGMTWTIAHHRPVVICEVDAPDRAGAEAKAAELTVALEGWAYDVERLPDAYPTTDWEVIHLLARPVGGRGVSVA